MEKSSTKWTGLKYQIDEQIPCTIAVQNSGPVRSLYDAALTVSHPALSSQDFAALAAKLLLVAFQKSYTDVQALAFLARTICDGDGVPSTGYLPTGTEFVVGVEYSSVKMPVGDRMIVIPSVRLTAYRPVNNQNGMALPQIGEKADYCRGVLELTMEQGMILITDRRGWLGSNEIVAYLRKAFEAAVE